MGSDRVENHSWMLGTFDEESCRFFLREVGDRIVPFFPFSVGIEEVYALLLERYGRSRIADALSVLHELLEDEKNALGIGDDGDIWRSWRHSWRYRNHGRMTPSSPKVGNFVLPLPTPRFVRLLKADNFTAIATQVEETLLPEAALPAATLDNSNAVAIALPVSPSDDVLVPRTQENSTTVECGSFSEVTPLELSNKRYSPRQSSAHRGTPAKDSVSHQDNSEQSADPKPTEKFLKPASLQLSSESLQSGSDNDSQQGFIEISLPADLDNFDPSLCLSFEMMKPASATTDGVGQGPLEVRQLQQIREGSHSRSTEYVDYIRESFFHQPEESVPIMLGRCDIVDHTRADSACSQAESHLKTTTCSEQPLNKAGKRGFAHRQARLIDGILTLKDRKAKKSSTSPRKDSVIESSSARSSPVRLSWSIPRQNQPFRQSWLQGVRSFFRHENDNKQKTHQRHCSSVSNSSYAAQQPGMSPSREQTVCEVPFHATQGKVPDYGLTLDGTFDNHSPPKSPQLAEKPLPLRPGERPRSRSFSSPTMTPSLSYSQHTIKLPSTASTVSSNLSSISSRLASRSAVRDMGDQRYINEIEEEHGVFLDPAKNDTAHSLKSQQSSISFSSVAAANPFRPNAILQSTTPQPLICYRKASDPQRGYEAHFLPQSPSGSKVPQSALLPMNNAAHVIQGVSTTEGVLGNHEQESAHEMAQRGRATREKDLSIQTGEFRKQAKKRSRSPVKKLLGFGKSNSLKDIAGEPQSKSVSDIASPSKGYGARSWTNKLRHGFLTCDDVDSSPSSGRPSKDASVQEPRTLTISLDPPYQAKVQCELELMLVITANRYLLREFGDGRVSSDSVTKLREVWTRINRPQVVEFQYDQLSQRDLIAANLNEIKVHGECAVSAVVLHTALHSWRTMAKEMAVRTYCTPDSVIRKWLHDAHKIFEMMGAPVPTFLALQELQVKTLCKMTDEQRLRAERSGGHSRNASSGSNEQSVGVQPTTPRSRMGQSSSNTPQMKSAARKATGAAGAIAGLTSPNSDARDFYENSRGGRLGLKVRTEGRS